MALSHAEGAGALEPAPPVCRLCPVAAVRSGDAVSGMMLVAIHPSWIFKRKPSNTC